MAVVSRNPLVKTHRLGGSSHLQLPVSLNCFQLTPAIFLLKIHFLLAALLVVVAMAVVSAVAVAGHTNLKIQLRQSSNGHWSKTTRPIR